MGCASAIFESVLVEARGTRRAIGVAVVQRSHDILMKDRSPLADKVLQVLIEVGRQEVVVRQVAWSGDIVQRLFEL